MRAPREGSRQSTPEFAISTAFALAVALAIPSLAEALPVTQCPTALARAQIDAVGAATVAWYIDLVSAAQAETPRLFDPVCPDSPPLDLTLVPPIHAAILSIFLVPDYIDAVPFDDPWGHPYEYRLNVAEPLSADVIAIRSAGSDGVYEGTTYDVRSTSGPSDDLVFYNDAWVRDVPRLDPVSRQRVTVEQVREVGDALLNWITDVVSAYSSSAKESFPGDFGSEVDMNDYKSISTAELSALLTTPPIFYTRCVPAVDGWGTPYDYRLNSNVLGSRVAAIRSFGSDATADGDVYPISPFPADEREHDILWADGYMAREPDDSGLAIFLDGFESAELWGYWSCAPGY